MDGPERDREVTNTSWTRPDRAVILVVLALFSLLGWQVMQGWRPGGTDDSQPVRLVGVRANAGDEIYNAAGRLITNSIYDGRFLQSWPTNTLEREFILELPYPADEILSPSVHYFTASSRSQRFASSAEVYAQDPRRSRVVARTQVPARIHARWWPFPSRARPTRQVNLQVHYYHRFDSNRLVIPGPFELGREVRTPELVLRVPTEATDAGGRRSFELVMDPDWHPEGMPYLLALDRAGNRLDLTRLRFNRYASNLVIGFSPNTPYVDAIDRVELIPKRSANFTRIRIDSVAPPPNPYPAALDDLAEALEWAQSMDSLIHRPFRSAREVLGVLEWLRGPLIVKGWRVLETSARANDPEAIWQSLNDQERERVRHTARRWIAANNPEVRAAGINLGLMAGWAEFLSPAVDLFLLSDPRPSSLVLRWLEKDCRKLADTDRRRLVGVLAQKPSSATARMLLPVLLCEPSSFPREPMLELALGDQPTLWWTILEAIPIETWGAFETLPAPLQHRLWLVQPSIPAPSAPEFAQVERTLGHLLQPRLWYADPTTFLKVLNAVTRKLSPEQATPMLIDFLTAMPHLERIQHPACVIVRSLNLWHGQNWGGLGQDPATKGPSHLEAKEWRRVLEEILAWRRAHGNAYFRDRGTFMDKMLAPWVTRPLPPVMILRTRKPVLGSFLRGGSLMRCSTSNWRGFCFELVGIVS